MKLTPQERLLVTGSEEEIAERMESRACAVVDWRGTFEEIVAAFARFLPKGTISLEVHADFMGATVRTTRASATVRARPKRPAGLDMAAAIAAILPPPWKARALALTMDSDTHAYLVRKASWWAAFRKAHPSRYRSVFAREKALPNDYELGPPAPTRAAKKRTTRAPARARTRSG